jgi:hypothetical protein
MAYEENDNDNHNEVQCSLFQTPFFVSFSACIMSSVQPDKHPHLSVHPVFTKPNVLVVKSLHESIQ